MGGCPSPSGKRGPVPPPRPKSRRNRLPETRHPQSHGLDDLHITIKQPNIKPSNIVQLHQIKDGFQMFSIHQRIHLNWFILPKTRFFSHNPSTCSIFHLFVKEKRNFLWFPQQFPRNSILGAEVPAKTPPTRTLGHQALEGDISNNELQMYGKLCMTNHTMDIHGVSGWCLIVVLCCFSIFKNPRATNKIQTNQWSTWEVRARTLTWMSATTPSKSCRASKYTWAVYCLGMAQNIST